MTDTDWKGIEQYAREIARHTVKKIIDSEHKKELHDPICIDSTQQRQIDITIQALERYRESRPESAIRIVMDRLIDQHARLVNPNDRHYRKRHNILVLKYIVSQPMSDKDIKRKLGMKAYGNGFENQLQKGIREITALLFYDWDLWDM